MPVKLRLQRHGKKGRPFYHIVAADSRAKRDGRFIEKVGTYDPNTDPAQINLVFDRALYWIEQGAQPTDTTRAILSYEGVMMRDHLNRGVKKGALTQDQADAKFAKWKEEKAARIQANLDGINKSESDKRAAIEKAESEALAKHQEELAAKAAEAEAAAKAAEAPAEEETAEEAGEAKEEAAE